MSKLSKNYIELQFFNILHVLLRSGRARKNPNLVICIKNLTKLTKKNLESLPNSSKVLAQDNSRFSPAFQDYW